ncbi:MAG: response regulator [Chlamydiales bacterium]|nr:response regulator [Chlamydiales bacterium]
MGKKVLLVDDDPDMVKVMTFRLKSAGFELVSCTSGKEALEKVKASSPNIVLLDIQMPDMTGLEVADGIQGNEATKNIPIIFLTGKVDVDKSQIEGKPNREIMLKPCDFDELICKINEKTG